MEIVWTKDIEEKQFVSFDYECRPLMKDSKLFYAYSSTDTENLDYRGYFGTKIIVIEINLTDQTSNLRYIRFKNEEPVGEEILLTNDWQFKVKENGVFLFVGFWLDLNKPEISIADIKDEVDIRKVKTDYYFKDLHLKYNQGSIIECFDKGTKNQKWRIKIKGFLYTDILLKNNCLTFGTAGRGGAFYCVELESGKILTEYVNKNASEFEWMNDSIVLSDTVGNLVQIDPYSGKVLNELKLKDKLLRTPILVNKDYIYTTLHNKEKDIAKIVCIKWR